MRRPACAARSCRRARRLPCAPSPAAAARSRTRWSICGRMRPAAKCGITSATNRGTPAARCALVRSLFETPNSVEALRVQRLEVDVGMQHAVDVADGREPTLERHRAHVLGEHRAAHRVDHEVGAVPAGRLASPHARSRRRACAARGRGRATSSASSLSAEPDVPITFAPSTFASCSEATPTPEDTPLMSSHSPAFSRPCSTSMS